MKIKTKKQLTLPQLIEWGFENGAHGVQFKSDRGKRVGFRHMGYFWTEYEIDKDELFTIITEEEITEDTVIEKLYHTTIPSRIVESGCSTIKSTLEHSTVEPIAFYILNDDLTMTLIWTHEKGLVE